MFALSYTNISFKLKYILYKANKLIRIYSYVITSLPKEAQVFNNTTMSSFYSSKPITLAGRGARHLLLAASDILLESQGLLC